MNAKIDFIDSQAPLMDDKAAPAPDMKKLREAIPKHCFQPSNTLSFAYIVRDLCLSAVLVYLALHIQLVDSIAIRSLLWLGYGVAQGMVMTGVWILAHECGHQALFTNRLVNDSLGFILHSLLCVPYFSWKYSHGLHHRYANHMEKDTAFVPYRKDESNTTAAIFEFLHLAEDTPAITLAQLVFHQLLGFPMYLLTNVSAGAKSLQRSDRQKSGRQSHFDPWGDYWTSSQHPFILLSDIGLAAMIGALYFLGTQIGHWNVALLYTVPYLWTNHWIVAITFLHHTHPEASHFEADTWNFRDGALQTIDRDLGWIGKHLFHGIIEFHVIHHLFARIPFYHAEEATDAISGVLGDRYLRVQTPFLWDLWETFKSCRFVEPTGHGTGILVWSRT